MNEEMLLKENERIDDLEINGFRIIQNPSSFCFGMDAVLLANFASSKKNFRVADLGTGTGIIPLVMAAKGKGKEFVAFEIIPEMADMASRSGRLNGIEEKFHVINMDIRDIIPNPDISQESNKIDNSDMIRKGTFDFVTSNPPYIKVDSGLHNPSSFLNVARHEISVTLHDIIQTAAYLLKDKGSFAMVHKPFRLPEIITELKTAGLEPKRLRLVQPKSGKEPSTILIEAVKGGGEFLRIEPTLVVYDDEGNYTEDVLEIYGKL